LYCYVLFLLDQPMIETQILNTKQYPKFFVVIEFRNYDNNKKL
jgi:hypothetical protein